MACSISNCEVTRRFNPNNYTFHSFPKKRRLREKWIQIANRQDWTPTVASVICSKHFKPECLIQRKHRRLLVRDTIPTLFVPLQDTVEGQSSSGAYASKYADYLQPLQDTVEGQSSSGAYANKYTDHLQPADDIVANVYNYLQTEYEELKSRIGDSCDLSPLANILKRTASATGVSEDTVSAILENKKRAADCERDADVKRVKLMHDYEDGNVSPITDEESSCEETDGEQEDDNESTHDDTQQTTDFEVEELKIEVDDVDEYKPLDPLQWQMGEMDCDVPSVSNTTHIKITTQPGVVVYPQSSAGALRVMSIEPITSLATIKTEPDDEHTHSSVTCTGDVECDTTLCDVKCEPPDS